MSKVLHEPVDFACEGAGRVLVPVGRLRHFSLKAAAEYAINRTPKQVDADRLLKTAIRARSFRLDHNRGPASTYHDNGYRFELIVFSNRTDEMEPASAGQRDIGNDEIGRVLTSNCKALFCLGCGAHCVSLESK